VSADICRPHIDLVRRAVEDLGLGALIADSEEEMHQRAQTALLLGPSVDTFEPLSYCAGIIGHAACQFYGQMSACEYFGHKAVHADAMCLLCGAIRVHTRDCGGFDCGPLVWIRDAANMTLAMWHRVNA
jgi:hypothetical protein